MSGRELARRLRELPEYTPDLLRMAQEHTGEDGAVDLHAMRRDPGRLERAIEEIENYYRQAESVKNRIRGRISA